MQTYVNPMSSRFGRHALRTLTLSFDASVEKLKAEEPQHLVSLLCECIGSDSVSFLTAHAVISRTMIPGEPPTFGAVVGCIRESLENEYLLREAGAKEGDPVGRHFIKSRETLWVKISRLRSTSAPLEHEAFTKAAMSLLWLFLRTFEGDEAFVLDVQFSKGRRDKRVIAHPELVRALAEGDPLPALEKPGTSPEPVGLIVPKRGPYPCIIHSKQELPIWNRYSFSKELSRAYESLRNHTPSLLFPWTDPIVPREGDSRQRKNLAYRLELARRQKMFIVKSGMASLEDCMGGGTFSYPVKLDFRGRVYLGTPGSPQFLKPLRHYLRTPEGVPYDFYDMRTSNISLLQLMLFGKIEPGPDLYEQIAEHLRYSWSHLLEERLGCPDREMAKTLYKAVYFGQSKVSGYNQAIRMAVQDLGVYDDQLRQELKQAYYAGYEFAQSKVPLPDFVKPEKDITLLLDDLTVRLDYRKMSLSRPSSMIYGFRVRMSYTWESEELAWAPTRTALLPNIVHTLESWILRRQLRYLSQHGLTCVPVHDCLGLPRDMPEYHKMELVKILGETVGDFLGVLESSGLNLTTAHSVCNNDLEFHELYMLENKHVDLSNITLPSDAAIV